MQEHWQRFGPPSYIPVAGYFGLGLMGKKKPKGPRRPGMPDPPDSAEDPLAPGPQKGNLRELARMFGAGPGKPGRIG